MSKFSPRIYALLFLSFCFSGSFSTPTTTGGNIDSLLQAFNGASNTVDKVDLALVLSEDYQKPDREKSWKYAKLAYDLSVSNDYPKGAAKSYFRFGKLLAKSSAHDSALYYYGKSFTIFEQNKDSANMASTLQSIGISHYFLSDYKKALNAYHKGINIFQALGKTAKSAGLYYNIGLIYRFTKSPDSAMIFFQNSLELRRKEGNKRKVTKCLKTIGSIKFDLGKYEEANEYLSMAINEERVTRDTSGLIQSYIEVGRLHQIKGDIILAIENYTKALNLAQETENHINAAVCYLNIGEIHRVLKDYDGAYFNYNKSLEIRKRINNRDGIAACYLRLGQLKVYQDKHDSAAVFFRWSVETYTSTGNKSGLAAAQRNLGALYNEHGHPDSAIFYLWKSVEIYRARSDEKGAVESEMFLASALNNNGETKKAIQILRNVYKWSSENEVGEIVRESAGSLAEILASLGEYEDAYYFRTVHKEYNDKLLSSKNISQVALKEYKFMSEKKEQARIMEQIKREAELEGNIHSERNTRNTLILATLMLLIITIIVFRMAFLRRKRNERLNEQKINLNKKNKALHQLSEELKSALEQKNTLIKEVHHRVKNNLQVISSLLNTQLYNLSDDQAIHAIRESQNRIKAMVLIHQNIYQSNDVSVVKSSKYIEDMVNSICRSNSDGFAPKLDLKLEDIDIDLNRAIPIGLIINELITNSFKYAFENRGDNKLEVSLSYNSDHHKDVMLTVKDNGKGLSHHIGKAKGFGLELVKGLTSQLGGTINVNSEKGKGTSIEVMFQPSV